MAKYAGRGVGLNVDGMDVPNFSSISSSGGEAERIDVTTHDTVGRYREFRSSFASEITITFDIMYDPCDPGHQHLIELFQTGQVVPVIVEMWGVPEQTPEVTDAPVITFNGFISAFPIPAFPIDGPWTVTVSITLAGELAWPEPCAAAPPPATQQAA